MTNAYADLTTLKSSGVLNITSAGFDARLLALLEGVSRWIETYCDRRFYVLTDTRQFDGDGGTVLHVPDLISVATLKSDENLDRIYELTWASTDYLLYPLNAQPQQPWGRPYTRVLVDTQAGSRPAFPAGQATVEIAGQWGYREFTEDSGADINEGGIFSASDTTLTVTDGAKFAVGQTALVESEQLYIAAIAANDLTVVRGVNGTTAATHANDADISLYRYPGAVVEACLMQTGRLWHRRDTDLVELTTSTKGPGLDRDVQQLLFPYRRLPVGLGV